MFLLGTLVPAVVIANDASSPATQSYLDSLVERSKEKKLANEPVWQVLLHYRGNWSGPGVTSEIDSEAFFFAEGGNTTPQAELEATLAAFFSSKGVGRQKLLPQCAFPARYRWLKEHLGFDPELMPEQQCASLNLW